MRLAAVFRRRFRSSRISLKGEAWRISDPLLRQEIAECLAAFPFSLDGVVDEGPVPGASPENTLSPPAHQGSFRAVDKRIEEAVVLTAADPTIRTLTGVRSSSVSKAIVVSGVSIHLPIGIRRISSSSDGTRLAVAKDISYKRLKFRYERTFSVSPTPSVAKRQINAATSLYLKWKGISRGRWGHEDMGDSDPSSLVSLISVIG